MAHFAKIENGIVTNVIVVNNDDCSGGTFPDSEEPGKTFIESLGIKGDWKQTSYSGSFRGIFAGIGMEYDSISDEFIASSAPIEEVTE